jgi:single-strand DNA-binding protein
MSVNQVHLLGRCGQDPEIRSVGQNNVNRATFSLCTGSKYKTHEGREIDDTCWHNIVAWRSLADLAQQYIRKGSQLFIIGHLSYRKYTDNAGIERYVTEIIADRIELCGSRQERQIGELATSSTEVSAPVNKQEKPSLDDIGDLPPDDGLPF